jgi:hypothetical protein
VFAQTAHITLIVFCIVVTVLDLCDIVIGRVQLQVDIGIKLLPVVVDERH